MPFVKPVLYFDIYTQMAVQASFGGVMFISHKLGVVNLLLDPLTYAWVGDCDFYLPCCLAMSESMFFPSTHSSPCQFVTFNV